MGYLLLALFSSPMWHVCRKHRKWKRMCCFEGTCWNQIKAHAPKVKDTTWWCIRLRTGACNQSDNTPWWCMRNKMEEPQGKGQMGQRLAFYTSMKLYITSSVSVARPSIDDITIGVCWCRLSLKYLHSLQNYETAILSVHWVNHIFLSTQSPF